MKARQCLHTEVVKALVACSALLACSCSREEPSEDASVGAIRPSRLIEFRPRLDCGASQPIAYEGYAGEFFGCLGPPCGIAIEDVHIVQGIAGYALEIRLSEAELFKLESFRKALHAGDSFVFLCGTVLTCLNMGETKISNPLFFEIPSIPSSSLERIKICLSIDETLTPNASREPLHGRRVRSGMSLEQPTRRESQVDGEARPSAIGLEVIRLVPPAGAEVWFDVRRSVMHESSEADSLLQHVRSGGRLSADQMACALRAARCVEMRWVDDSHTGLLASACLPSWLPDRWIMIRPVKMEGENVICREYRVPSRGRFVSGETSAADSEAGGLDVEVLIGIGAGSESQEEYRGVTEFPVLLPLKSTGISSAIQANEVSSAIMSETSARILWFASDPVDPYRVEICFRYDATAGSILCEYAFAFDVRVLFDGEQLGESILTPRAAWRAPAEGSEARIVFEGRCLLTGISQEVLLDPKRRSRVCIRISDNDERARWQMHGSKLWHGVIDMNLDCALANQLVAARPWDGK